MMTRLGPNYGQESESNKGIDLYKHVHFTEHIKKTTEMLETSNLRTKESRLIVAQHYNISNAWREKEREFSDEENEICEIINAFNSMRWEQGYDFQHDGVQYNVYFDIMEGRHRWVASICTNESSRYDQNCPKIEYGSLDDEYIKESLIQNNANKPFATNTWKEVIKNSKFNAKEKACKQVKNGTYGMKSQIKFSVHTIHLKSAPEDEKVLKKDGSQEKLIYYLNNISAQSRLSKGHVSKPSTLESLEVTLGEANIELKRKKVSRRLFSANPNRIKIGTTLQELFKPIIVGQTPVNSALMKLKKNYTIGKEEETISSYHEMSPNGFLDDTQEIKHYIEQPNTNTFTLLQDKFTSFVETNQGNADELFKDYSESIHNKEFDPKFYYRNNYIETGREPRFKGNEKLDSSKHTLKPPFPLTYYNLLQNKKKPKNREQPVLLSLSTMNHLLMIPLIHKCCREFIRDGKRFVKAYYLAHRNAIFQTLSDPQVIAYCYGDRTVKSTRNGKLVTSKDRFEILYRSSTRDNCNMLIGPRFTYDMMRNIIPFLEEDGSHTVRQFLAQGKNAPSDTDYDEFIASFDKSIDEAKSKQAARKKRYR